MRGVGGSKQLLRSHLVIYRAVTFDVEPYYQAKSPRLGLEM